MTILLGSPAFAKPQGVRQAFAEAQLVYSKGDFAKAAQLLTKNLENYPSHEASILFLGKSLFRLGKLDDAWTAFKNVNQSSLDSESKYEYGYSAYRSKDWEKAAKILVTVPDSNQNYDLAMYYASVSLMNLDRYKEAEISMKKAVVLPSRFVSSRTAILKFLKNENSSQIQNVPRDPNPVVDQSPQKPTSNQAKTSNQPVQSAANSKPAKPEPLSNGKNRYPMTIDTGAEVLYVEEPEFEDNRKQKAQWQPGPESSMGLMLLGERLLQDMSGVKKDILSSTSSGAYINGHTRTQNLGFGLGVNYELSGASVKTHGSIRPVCLDSYKDLDMWESAIPYFTSLPPKSQIFAKLVLGLEYHDSGATWILYGSGKGFEFSDEAHRAVNGGLRFDFEGERIILSFGGEINDWRGAQYEKLRSSSVFGKALFPLNGNLNLGLSIGRHRIEEPLQTLEFPLGLNQFEIVAEQAFALGFKLKVNAGLMGIENYLRGNSQSGTTVADGTRAYAGIEASWIPLKWLIVSAGQQNATLRWSQIQPSTNADSWTAAVPDYAESSFVEFKFYRPF